MAASNIYSPMPEDTFAAWSMYTGPANVAGLWDGSSWMVGTWNGVQGGGSASAVKEDIDLRIEMVVKAFRLLRYQLTNRQRVTGRHYFVIPEFFFHSSQGPYPYIKIAGEYPFEYIRRELQSMFERMGRQGELHEGEFWIIAIGSILTCSEPDICGLLGTKRVTDRLNALNVAIAALGVRAAFPRGGRFIRAFSYFKRAVPQTPQQNDVDRLMDEYRSNPLCIVRNRGALFSISSRRVEHFGYEKQYESTVDLTMGEFVDNKLEASGMVTQWIASYPPVSIIGGDTHSSDAPWAARIRVHSPSGAPVEVGVEICLDHRQKRLRRTVGMTAANGADADNRPLDVQLVPSGGMQVLDQSIAAGRCGAIFNCDGWDPILTSYDEGGQVVNDFVFKQMLCGVYVLSAQTLSSSATMEYASHSQLCFRYGGEISGYDNAAGSANANGLTYGPTGNNPALDSYLPPTIVPILDPDPTPLFAAAFGELHIYLTP
jgi:hypothetical protein